jgi:hypothetical protein
MDMNPKKPACYLAGKSRAFCPRAEMSLSTRSLKAPQATFSR